MLAVGRSVRGGNRRNRRCRGDVIQGVERFNAEQKVQTKTLASVEKVLDRLLTFFDPRLLWQARRNDLIQYIVSGGGGAYMSATHRVPRVDVGGVEEDDFRCHPLRGDSLSAYSKVVDHRFFLGLGSAYIAPAEAAALMGVRLGIDPSRPGDRHKRPRRLKEVVGRLPFLRTPRPRRDPRSFEPYFYPLLSELFDWDPRLSSSVSYGSKRPRIS